MRLFRSSMQLSIPAMDEPMDGGVPASSYPRLHQATQGSGQRRQAFTRLNGGVFTKASVRLPTRQALLFPEPGGCSISHLASLFSPNNDLHSCLSGSVYSP